MCALVRLGFILMIIGCAGTAGGSGSDDASTSADAGVSGLRLDAGQVSLRDAGLLPNDAGGLYSIDGGTAPAKDDGGSPLSDAGTDGEDAGEAFDAGEPIDAGSIFDAGLPPVHDAGSVSRADAGTLCTGGAPPLIFDMAVTSLSSCQTLSEAGSYRLTANLMKLSGTCLTISNIDGIRLNCDGHTIAGQTPISISNTLRFEITGCHFEMPLQGQRIEIIDAGIGFIHDNSFDGGTVDVALVSDVHAYQNLFVTAWQNNHVSTSSVSCNTMISPTTDNLISGLITSNFGDSNRFENNLIDGRWDEARPVKYAGADDGIILQDESAALIRGNTIKRVFDTGIEWVGVVRNVTIEDNDIERTGFYGIGGFYWSSVQNCRFINNRISQTTAAFVFLRTYGLRAASSDRPADTSVAFTNNLLDGNTFTGAVFPSLPVAYVPVYSKMFFNGSLSSVQGERAPTDSDFVLAGNVFRNNSFDTSAAPINFGSGPVIPGAIIDEGNNRCPFAAGAPVQCVP